MRVIQFLDEAGRTRVGSVEASVHREASARGTRSTDAERRGRIVPLAQPCLLVDLAEQAWQQSLRLDQLIREQKKADPLPYQPLLDQQRVLPPVTARDPAHHLLSGTGLTHMGSATARHEMHGSVSAAEETDSLKLFRLGLAQGKPPNGAIGVQPEWFFKGNGYNLVAPERDLAVPAFSLDAGEEPEIVGHYWVSSTGQPCRLGFSLGNELSDHVTEKQNYLYLAHSKLRPCSTGPELLLGKLPSELSGRSSIYREGNLLWQDTFFSGEAHMSHRIVGLEHHHFKYPQLRTPHSVHSHFFGTATLSCSAGIQTQSGDMFEICCELFGASLRNRLLVQSAEDAPRVHAL